MAKRWYYKDENGNKVPVPQYKINSDNHYTKSDADNKFATKESTDTKVAKTDIVQSVGNATDKIMSQKSVTDALSTKVDKTDIVQSTGTSETAVMSQKASTDSFIANTPSGDPMHNMYVAMGAVWNGSGVDKTYPTPWADYAEDEEDKVCVHKNGCWKFYDVGDLTNSDMIYVYRDFGLNIKFTNLQFIESKSRIISLGWHNDAKSFMNDGYEPFALCGNLIEIAFYKNGTGIVNIQGNCAYIFAFSPNLKYIYGNLNFTESISNTSFINCLDLRIIFVNNLRSSISFKDSPKLSKHCVRYMIENATDATITITLHPEAYKRAIADTGVQTALANKTNVSLVKVSEYLTLSALEDGEITIEISSDLGSACATYLSYSKDKSVWKRTDVDGRDHTITIPVSRGDNVYLKGKAKQWYYPSGPGGASINSSANINVSGNIMSLLYEDNFEDKAVFPDNSQYAFGMLFVSNKHLCSAEKLILPATTLVDGCYRFMFSHCSSLTVAPALPATKLVENCYWGMFIGCTSLNSITMLATDISAMNCLDDWVSGVAATGTFKKAASMTSLPSGVSGIPTGWTVENV